MTVSPQLNYVDTLPQEIVALELRHYGCTAVFVNMVFSDEEKILNF